MSTRRGGRGGGDDKDSKPPRFTAQQKGKAPVTTSNEETNPDPPLAWDWRCSPGIVGSVLNQKAMSLVRAIQALMNIGVPLARQVELSIQHVVNNVAYDEDDGILNVKRAFEFSGTEGLCINSQCPPPTFDNNVAKKLKCRHGQINTHKVDGFEYIQEVDDNELLATVFRQPVIGILRNTGAPFSDIGSGIYRSPIGGKDVSFHQVLIVGYGADSRGRPYWIIQDSYGESWGDGGFGYVHRRVLSGRGSEFYAVAYPKIRGYPRKPDGA